MATFKAYYQGVDYTYTLKYADFEAMLEVNYGSDTIDRLWATLNSNTIDFEWWLGAQVGLRDQVTSDDLEAAVEAYIVEQLDDDDNGDDPLADAADPLPPN